MPRRARPPQDVSKAPFPTKQLIIIGICRFSEPIAFNSILAYSYIMCQDLGIPQKDASFYSGLLVSAYALSEATTAIGWGAISDVYGRKPVALIGLGGVALSGLLFGFAKNYWVALLARVIGGALNGNVAIMQTMVAEVVVNPEHEPKAYATQPFVWTLGSIIGSAMGGFAAKPAIYYPDYFSADGVFGRYPYLLPNLIACISITFAIIQGCLFMEETNPAFKTDSAIDDDEDEGEVDERTPLNHQPRNRDRSNSVIRAIRESRNSQSFMEESMPMPIDQHFDIRRQSFGTMHSITVPHDQHTEEPESSEPQKTYTYSVMMITLALIIICYHQMAFIANIPVWILDKPRNPFGQVDLIGGLGYSLHDVGTYLAVNGFIALFIQGVVFPPFVETIGVWKSYVIMLTLYPTLYFIIPFISALPEPLVSPGVYLVFILQDIFGIIVYPCALILLKNVTPSPSVLGRVNGMAMSACCLARTVSSPLTGAIYSIGGSAAAWWSLGIVSILGIVQLYWIPTEHIGKVSVESGIKKGSRHDSGHSGDTDESVIES